MHNIVGASHTLTHLSADMLLDSFCPAGFVDIGGPIGTDAFVRTFVVKTCWTIIDDVEKLDVIQDGFIHHQPHILLVNRCTLQQHVDCKITVLVCNSMMLLRTLCFILLLHGL